MMSNEGTREHFWDALRALLMLLGIPYHVALSYQIRQDFIVHSGEGVPGFREFAEMLHLWRMPAFFVIAGYFAMLLLARRDPGAWLKSRFMRLGLPFLTGIAILVPAMNLVCELSNLPWHEAVRSWRHNTLTSGGYGVRHLWFIIVLLYFAAAAAWLATRSSSVRTGMIPPQIDSWCARHFIPTFLGLAVLVGAWEAFALEAFYAAGLATMVPQQILRLDEVVIYVPWFALGGVLVRSRQTLARVCCFSWPVAALAIAAAVSWLLLHQDVSPMAERFIGTVAALAMTQMLIAGARMYLDQPIAIVRKLTDASFVIYLIHLPVIVLLVWLAQPLAMPPAAKAAAIMALALGLSYAAWLGIRRVRGMALLFEGLQVPRIRPALA
jgi:glucan biosynthesis protein C